MAVRFTCCSMMLGKKKKYKVDAESSESPDFTNNLRNLKIRLECQKKPFERDDCKTSSLTVVVPLTVVDAKVTSLEKAVRDKEVPEKAYEGEDEHEENASMKMDFSDFDIQGHAANSDDEQFTPRSGRMSYCKSFDTKLNEDLANRSCEDIEKGIDSVQTGHLSDPGANKPDLWSSSKLKRSCSNLETNKVLRKVANKSIQTATYSRITKDVPKNLMAPGSPESAISHRSADRVMLKKHSSSQVLPSRSRKLWWKLFLWSHRNLHKSRSSKPRAEAASADQQAGYTSDTVEPNRASKLSKQKSSVSFAEDSRNKYCDNNEDSGLWPQDQWIVFSTGSSSYARVDAWVRDLDQQASSQSFRYNEDNNNDYEGIVFPASPENGKSSKWSATTYAKRPDVNLPEDILYANYVIQSLNSSSTVAHISGIGLRVIPMLSRFFSLRSVNLSNNSITCITPGSLPKGLHTLDLSRNRIHTIEGLRELTRLRVLDLSYNRITRIGQGLSNCTIIKELYLNGNKISEIDGLHRLLKLTILDLSFNKITTTKAIGQLVANYNSLQALNLLGNPIQSNIGDDQLQKSVCSLLPKLVYLNKQQIKPQRTQVVTDTVAKAAVRTSSGWSSRRRAINKRGNSDGSGSSKHRGSPVAREKSRSRSRGRLDRINTMRSARASASH